MTRQSSKSGAVFSQCRQYRYALWRHWDMPGRDKQMMFVGLNPSTANEDTNDATIRRCIQFAKDWGYQGMIVTNVFGFCSTKPSGLKTAADPIGPKNDQILKEFLQEVDLIVAVWGNHCPINREKSICEVINQPIHCLGTTKSGRPKHPLYLPKDTSLRIFWSPDKETD